MPAVSAVIPCYNYAHYVTRAVESVIRQRGVDVEVIVVDDASPDDSATVLAGLAERHPQVRVVTHERNAGLIATINDGIAEASGDFLLVLSADDSLAPGTLARAVEVFSTYPEVGMVFGGRREFAEDRDLPSLERYSDAPAANVRPVVHTGTDWVAARCAQGINMIASPEVLVRMTVQRLIGAYDPDCRHTSDLNMWLRAAIASDVAFVPGEPFAYYRKHGLNMSTVEFGSLAVDLRERMTAYDRAIASAGSAEQRAAWRRSAARALATEALHEARRAHERGPDADARDTMIAVARELDPALARRAIAGDGTVRRDVIGRLVHRLRWRRWLRRWERTGR